MRSTFNGRSRWQRGVLSLDWKKRLKELDRVLQVTRRSLWQVDALLRGIWERVENVYIYIGLVFNYLRLLISLFYYWNTNSSGVFFSNKRLVEERDWENIRVTMSRLWFVYSTISRYFDNNWNLPAASKFPRRAVQTSFQLLQSPPLPQKWPLVSLSLSSFQIFQKYFSFFVLKPFFLKPFPNQRPNHFSIPFFSSLLLSSNFFLQIIPTSNYNCPTIPSPSLFRRNIQLLSTSSNFLKPRIPFFEWLKK